MSFTPNIPQTGQSLGQTRDPIRNNFTNYNTVVSQDHVAPNAVGQGKHNKSTYVVQGTPPVTLANEVALYSNTSNGNSEVFLQRDGVATNIRWSGPSSSLNGGLSRGGTTSILGGLMLKWAVVNPGVGTVIYTWATECGSAFNSTPIMFGILPPSVGTSAPSWSLSAVTATNFTVQGNINSAVTIIAIGA